MLRTIFLVLLVGFFIHNGEAAAMQGKSFTTWLADFKREAKELGINEQTFEKTMKGAAPIPKIIELDRKQPEKSISLEEYHRKVVTKARINEGRALLKKHHTLLKKIEEKYKVQPRFIVALWGIETSYGKVTGNYYLPHALATLAHDGRRGEYFKKELIELLTLVERKHVSPEQLKGSWAGAMGQCQFMPTSFSRFAKDGDGDKKRDIWKSQPDVFASIANYLHESGWEHDKTWGRKVTLPKHFDKAWLGAEVTKTVAEWRQKGVSGLPSKEFDALKASIVAPKDGSTKFLVYQNYKTLLLWNRSIYFATAVGKLADAIAP